MRLNTGLIRHLIMDRKGVNQDQRAQARSRKRSFVIGFSNAIVPSRAADDGTEPKPNCNSFDDEGLGPPVKKSQGRRMVRRTARACELALFTGYYILKNNYA